MNEPLDADEAPTPSETLFASLMGQVRQYLRERRGVQVLLVWSYSPDNDPHVALHVDSLSVADRLVSQAAIKVARLRRKPISEPLCEVSEFEDIDT